MNSKVKHILKELCRLVSIICLFYFVSWLVLTPSQAKGDLNVIIGHKVSVSWYTNSLRETDDTPNINACGKHPKIGDVAVSRDLYNEYSLHCGSKVFVKIGDKLNILTVADLMGERSIYRGKQIKQVDIFTPNKKQAFENGRQDGILILNFSSGSIN